MASGAYAHFGITSPQGVRKYVVAAFPSAYGKTNLAMMTPTLPGYKVECVGDDIAWMKFDKNGVYEQSIQKTVFLVLLLAQTSKLIPMR